jgi:hypothetical protein
MRRPYFGTALQDCVLCAVSLPAVGKSFATSLMKLPNSLLLQVSAVAFAVPAPTVLIVVLTEVTT